MLYEFRIGGVALRSYRDTENWLRHCDFIKAKQLQYFIVKQMQYIICLNLFKQKNSKAYFSYLYCKTK